MLLPASGEATLSPGAIAPSAMPHNARSLNPFASRELFKVPMPAPSTAWSLPLSPLARMNWLADTDG